MKSKDANRATTLEHEQALKVYIDALLLEPPPEPSAPEPQVSEPAGLPAPENAPLQSPLAAAEPEQSAEPQPVEDDAPFDCLLFKVAGALTLAVPLARLTGIVQWQDNLTAIPGYVDWLMGLTSHRGQQVKVVDIARVVIPAGHKSRQALTGERQFKHLLLIDGGSTGLACDELGRVVKLTRDKVRWRGDTAIRPWLAGTLVDEMSALLDVDKLSALLKEGVPRDEI